MAHFAELDDNNTVLRVIVVHNNEAPTEAKGIEFLKTIFPNISNWKQTSYNAKFRKHFAEVRAKYDEDLDAFIPPCNFKSWTFNKNKCMYEAPIPKPKCLARWNEDKFKWEIYGKDY